MMDNVLLRGTYIVGDMEAAIRFYRDALGWSLVYDSVLETDAVVVSPPAVWTVPGYAPGTVIRLQSMSLFDPNGLYVEVNKVLPPESAG